MASRTKNYTCLVYPDSAPSDWLERLSDLKVQCAVSPLHDRDVNSDGEYKKPHYHVVIMYDGVKTREQAKIDCKSFGGIVPPVPKQGVKDEFIVSSLRVMLRYLCHLDNPEKTLYDPESVICFGGFNYIDYIANEFDNYKLIEQICDFCELQKITSFYSLVLIARQRFPFWIKPLVNNAFFFKTFLQSATWTNKIPKGFYEDD